MLRRYDALGLGKSPSSSMRDNLSGFLICAKDTKVPPALALTLGPTFQGHKVKGRLILHDASGLRTTYKLLFFILRQFHLGLYAVLSIVNTITELSAWAEKP
jgi:hypothetical protein